MSNLQARLGTFIVMLFLTIGFGLAFRAKADDSPTPEDYANLADIQQNQKVLEETREAHEKFLLFKSYNEAEVSELAKNGWCVKFDKDPSKVDLERCPFALGQQ